MKKTNKLHTQDINQINLIYFFLAQYFSNKIYKRSIRSFFSSVDLDKIISNGKLYDKDQLTSRTISEGFVVYEKLYI